MIDNERKKKLSESMKRFNANQKAEIFTMGNEIEEIPVIPTGIESVDKFIGGGFKRGAHTIIYGAFSIGKTALVLMAIAHAQTLGYTVCFVNTEKPIEPERFEFFGIDLSNMVYIEAPANAEIALEALRTLTKDRVIDLFVIDSKDGLCPKSVQEDSKGKERGLDKNNVAALPKALSEFYNAVNAHIFKARAAVIWISQMRTKGIGSYFVRTGLTGGNAQTYYAYQIIEMKKGEKSNNPVKKFKEYWKDPEGKIRFETKDEEIGFSVVLKMIKTNSCKSVKENKEIEIPFYYDSGFTEVKIIKDEEPEIRIDPEATEEEKEIITKELIKKGILKEESKDYKLTNNKTIKIEEPKSEDLINAVITSTAIEGVKITKEDLIDTVSISGGAIPEQKQPEIKSIEVTKEPKKKGRGRPKKNA
jgi:RecA/RadA recombinase